MNTSLRRIARVVAVAKTAVSIAAALLLAWDAIHGQWLGTGAAAGVLVAVQVGRGLSVAALAVALGTQQWILATFAGTDLLVLAFEHFLVPRARPDPPDVGQLAAIVAALPECIVLELSVSTGSDGIIDTPAIVRCAIESDPTRWAPLTATRVPSRTGSEGGLVGGNWTLCAAESALVATCLDQADVDLHRLALAAMLIPFAACNKSTNFTAAAEKASGYGAHHLSRALKQAAWMPAGQLILARMESADRRQAHGREGELPDEQWRELLGPSKADVVWPGGGRPPGTTAAPAKRAAPATKLAAPAKPPRSRTPSKPSPARSRQRRHPARDLWRKARAEWPAAALISWWVLRPACTLAAIGVAVFGLFGSHPILAAAALAIAMLIRPTRSVWLGCAAATAAWWLDPPVAVLIAARTLTGTAVLLLIGPGWSAGTRALVRLRQRLTDTSGMDEAWSRLEASMRSVDHDDAETDDIPRVLVAAWSMASVSVIASAAARTARGVLRGQWPFPALQRFVTVFFRLHLINEIADKAVSVAIFLATFLVIWLAVPDEGHTVFGFQVYGWIAAAAAAWFAINAAKRGPIWGRAASVGIIGLVVFLSSGHQVLINLGIAAAMAIAGSAACQSIEKTSIAVRERPPRRLGGIRSLRVRDRWIAACAALADSRPQVARQIWGQIAQDQRLPAPTRAGALAALAGLALNAGDLQTALEQVSRAVELAGAARRSCGPVYVTASRINLTAGDYDKARDLLVHRSVGRRTRRDASYSAARAELLALDLDASRAVAELESSSIRLLGSGGLAGSIDLEVTALGHLLGTGAPADIIWQRTKSLLDFGVEHYTPRQELLIAPLARARVLLGRLQFQRGEAQDAAATLRRAVADLNDPREALDQASARIMLAAATAEFDQADGLRQMAEGIDQMEQARGALRAGQHRSQLIARHAPVYEIALDALTRLRQGNPQAGWLAAQLCESLCRSALAQTLRQGQLGISGAGRRLLASIGRLEAHDNGAEPGQAAGDLARLRADLQTVLSAAFATAYLPQAVDFSQLRRRLGDAHALSYRVHEASAAVLRGHVTWTQPGSAAPAIAKFCLDTEDLLTVLGLREPEEREKQMVTSGFGAAKNLWHELGTALLPPGLRMVLRQASTEAPEHIVLVPDGPLALLPWAAIQLDDGRFLAEAASLQYVPTLDLLEEESGPDATSGDLAVYLDPAMPGDEETSLLSAAHSILPVTSLDDLRERLATGNLTGAYIAAHGDDTGLRQRVELTGSGELSAAGALGLRWPAWVIFASCLVGQLKYQLGEDPLGLPVSCLIGGATSVIGGVIEISAVSSGRIAAGTASRLASPGLHPAEALRSAQLDYLSSSHLRTPRRWAGLVCLSRSVPARCHYRNLAG